MDVTSNSYNYMLYKSAVVVHDTGIYTIVRHHNTLVCTCRHRFINFTYHGLGKEGHAYIQYPLRPPSYT